MLGHCTFEVPVSHFPQTPNLPIAAETLCRYKRDYMLSDGRCSPCNPLSENFWFYRKPTAPAVALIIHRSRCLQGLASFFRLTRVSFDIAPIVAWISVGASRTECSIIPFLMLYFDGSIRIYKVFHLYHFQLRVGTLWSKNGRLLYHRTSRVELSKHRCAVGSHRTPRWCKYQLENRRLLEVLGIPPSKLLIVQSNCRSIARGDESGGGDHRSLATAWVDEIAFLEKHDCSSWRHREGPSTFLL